ncbi:unnamed protein product [Closterium sp. Naga37s-1]|nr:unnamed protein product [Closterium sp. Naga37s-1]
MARLSSVRLVTVAHAWKPVTVAHAFLPVASAHAFLPVANAHAFLPVARVHAFVPVAGAHAFVPVASAHDFLPGASAHDFNSADTWGMFCDAEQQEMATARFAALPMHHDHDACPHRRPRFPPPIALHVARAFPSRRPPLAVTSLHAVITIASPPTPSALSLIPSNRIYGRRCVPSPLPH